MQTTIKASKETKARLEKLRAEVARVKGRRVSQRELVDHMIVRASKDPSLIADSLSTEAEFMGPKEFRAFVRKRKPWGIADGSVGIDAWLYGGKP